MKFKYHAKTAASVSAVIILLGMALFTSAFFIETNSTLTMIFGAQLSLAGLMINAIVKLDALGAGFLAMIEATNTLVADLRSLSKPDSKMDKLGKELAEAIRDGIKSSKKKPASPVNHDEALRLLIKEAMSKTQSERVTHMASMIEEKGLAEFASEHRDVIGHATRLMKLAPDAKSKAQLEEFIDAMNEDFELAKAVEKTGKAEFTMMTSFDRDTYFRLEKAIELAEQNDTATVVFNDSRNRKTRVPMSIAKEMREQIRDKVRDEMNEDLGAEVKVH